VLPEPSYSLKVVEQRAGYERILDEYGGDWSMARYIEAVESNDSLEREKIIHNILDYNREDLEATWAVFQWLQKLVDSK
jgi:predicted RecB family nuclease